MLRFAIFVSLMFATISSSASEIEEIRVPTGEDGDVLAKFDKSTRLPRGASDDRAEVTGVYLAVSSGSGLQWTWVYSVKFKEGIVPTVIRVEDESQAPNLLEVEDRHPMLKGLNWIHESPKKPFTKEVFDYMQSKGTWFYMRKFIIDYPDGSKSVLHQPVLYTQAARIEILQTMMHKAK